MTDFSGRPAQEQLEALKADPQYLEVVEALAGTSTIIDNLHMMLPDEIELMIDDTIREVEKVYGKIDMNVCVALLEDYVVTWFAHQKKEFTDDPVGKLYDVFLTMLQLRTKIMAFSGSLPKV